MWATYRWASGHPLDQVLQDAELPAGDFVRWTKQVIDLLGQVADAVRVGEQSGAGAAGSPAVGEVARDAVTALRRGVVAWSTVA